MNNGKEGKGLGKTVNLWSSTCSLEMDLHCKMFSSVPKFRRLPKILASRHQTPQVPNYRRLLNSCNWTKLFWWQSSCLPPQFPLLQGKMNERKAVLHCSDIWSEFWGKHRWHILWPFSALRILLRVTRSAQNEKNDTKNGWKIHSWL